MIGIPIPRDIIPLVESVRRAPTSNSTPARPILNRATRPGPEFAAPEPAPAPAVRLVGRLRPARTFLRMLPGPRAIGPPRWRARAPARLPGPAVAAPGRCGARPDCEPPRCRCAGRHARASPGPRRIRFPGGQTRRWRVRPCGITTTPGPAAGPGSPGSRPFAPILPAGKAARPPRKATKPHPCGSSCGRAGFLSLPESRKPL